MKAEIYIKNISELPLVSGGKNDMRKKISCVTVNYEDAVTHFSTALYLDALITVFVLPFLYLLFYYFSDILFRSAKVVHFYVLMKFTGIFF